MTHIFQQIILSVLSLMVEIVYSTFRQKEMSKKINSELSLPAKFTFSYQCARCAHPQPAMDAFHEFYHSLVYDLNVTYLETAVIPREHKFELSILLVFQLKNPNQPNKIVQKFDEFKNYLDKIT